MHALIGEVIPHSARFSLVLFPGTFVGVRSWFITLLVCGGVTCVSLACAAETPWTADFRVAGCGGAYFLAESGEFWVDVEKQDLNRRGRKTHVRAILFGPDRSVVAEETLAWQGMEQGSGPGPVQRVRIAVQVPRAGIYGLNITASEDRYGEDMVWGLRTNCPKYLVETSRGHRDERHQEPLVLVNGDVPGAVCFLPRIGEFTLDVSGFRGETLRLLDATGAELASVPVGEDGTGAYTVPETISREHVPWQLHMSGANGTVNIDGVTRWDKVDGGYTNLSLWSPRADTWFPFHENRWLLTPYRRQVYLTSAAAGTVRFELHNNGWREKVVTLNLEFPEGDTWNAELDRRSVTLAPGETAPVSLAYFISPRGPSFQVFVRATVDDEFTTYSSVQVVFDTRQKDAPLTLPLVLRPYNHENALFGYAPQYPVTSEVYFDRENRPVVSSKNGVSIMRDGLWNETGIGSLRSSKVAFDVDNDWYTLALRDGKPALVHSRGSGATFRTYPIPGNGVFDLEQFSGHNLPAGPPPFVRFTRTAVDPKLKWRQVHDLDLFLPEKQAAGTITLGNPVRVSDQCIGLSSHSGIPSTIVSRGNKVHVAWAEATDPAADVPGVPTFVATWDRAAGTLSEPALVGYGPPANDVHNTPSITVDSQGYLHVLVGTHGRTFLYARSLKPNDAGSGWSEPEPLGADLRQTYVGFVCGPDDTLHVVFRLWHTDTTYFPTSHYATLSYMRKAPGEPWSAPQALVVPPFSEYSVFYHRLTIDRMGGLFLSYDYWSTYWFYRTDRRETRRALMTSGDGGATWKLATMEDLAP